MQLSQEEIIKRVKEQRIKSVRLAFCDIYGNEKNISIMPEQLSSAFTTGILINASAIKNFGEGIFSSLLLHPEAETFSVLPWRPENDPAARIFCSMTYPDGTPFEERGTKSLLIKAIKEAEDLGYEIVFGTQMEFYLFKTDKNGKPTKEPYDEAGYLDIAPDDKCELIRREICLALEEMGVKPKNAYHGEGPGQNKVEFGYADPLSAANDVVTLKSIIKNAAARHGAFADFSPKPLDDCPGNGFHINFSVRADDGTDDCLDAAVAGIIKNIKDMTLFLNSSEESYKRLTKARAPKYISWSSENHSQLLRIHERVYRYRMAELRCPDSCTNPYLAFALLINASLYGIKNSLELPPPSNFEFETADAATLSNYEKLPESFDEAARITLESEFIKQHLSEDIIRMYTTKK